MTLQEALSREDRIAYNLTGHDDKAAVRLVFETLRELAELIPVTERLPEDGQQVWVCTERGSYCVARYSKMFNTFRGPGNIVVTHWLPQPPRPQKEREMSNFEIAKLAVMVIGVVVVLVSMHGLKRPPICDSCKALRQKHSPFSLEHFRYSCGRHGGFDRPPLFCNDYQKREDGDYNGRR